MAQSSVGEEKWRPVEETFSASLGPIQGPSNRGGKEEAQGAKDNSSSHSRRLDWHAAASGCEPKQAIRDKDEKPVGTVDGRKQS